MTTLDSLVARLDALDVRVSVRKGRLRLNAPPGVLTPELQAEIASRKEELKARFQDPAAAEPIRAVARGDTAPVSFGQQRLWFLHQFDPASPAYNLGQVVRFRGQLDVGALERSVQALVERHEVLRTTFRVEADLPVQVVSPSATVTLRVDDPTGDTDAAREANLESQLRQAILAPFDLAVGPLFEARVWRLGRDHHVLLLRMHHIVSDGWSMGILFGELSRLYVGFVSGRPASLPPLPVQYADFAVWQRRWLSGAALARELGHWRERLAGVPVLELPTDRPRPAVASVEGAGLSFWLDPALLKRLYELSSRSNVTLAITLLAAFKVLLHRHTGQTDVAVGVPIANRTQGRTESLIGFFVNLLVMRTDMSGDPSFAELLARLKRVSLDAYEHQDLPFDKLVEELEVERDQSRTPLFQVMFSMQPAKGQGHSIPGLQAEELLLGPATSKFDLTLDLGETEEGLRGVFEYSTALFDRTTIERLSRHFANLLEAIVANPGQTLTQLQLLSEDERTRLLEEWNDTEADYPREASLPGLVAAQTARTPDAIAIVSTSESLTYRALHRRSNQLARYLRRHGVRPGVHVAIWLERSVDLVVTVLGVLKAGGAYVPIDPAFPSERVELMLTDSSASVVVTEVALAQLVPSGPTVVEAGVAMAALANESAEDLAEAVDPASLAYVMYTSGSTGRPKGVMVPHGCATNFLTSMARTPGLTSDDVLLAVTTLSFDISVLELMLPLTVGARIWLADTATTSDGRLLAAAIARSGATIMQATPATWRLLFEAEWQGAPSLTVLCGGEALPAALAERLTGCVRALWNMYGPTETTVWSTCGPVTRDATITVGRPIANTQIYVLDRSRQLVPAGVAGELFIGGTGVTAGYWGRPELTAERFLPDHLGHAEGARLYWTGDVARWRAEGALEHLGRADRQVKIRGHRIEPGEIEAVLERHPAVVACAVEPRTVSGDLQLVAYVVGEAGRAESVSAFRDFLRASLPDYMVPARFVSLDALPLTPNGKVDRRALPLPDQSRGEQVEFEPPRTRTERALATLWSEVLGVETIGVRDDFFHLGGHSLLATRLVSRVRAFFDVEYPLRAIFDGPTVAEQARDVDRLLADGGRREEIPLSPVGRNSDLPLSHAQERLWFLDRLDAASPAYNIPSAVRLKGPLSLAALSHALEEIRRRHMVLRARFIHGRDGPRQEIGPPAFGTLAVVDLSALPDAARLSGTLRLAAEEANRAFDLTNGPLMRATVVTLAESDHVLLLTMHHIVSDAWSIGILVGELSELYKTFSSGSTSPLPDLEVEYTDFADWQRRWLDAGALDRQLGYWRRRLAGAPQSLELATDRPRPAVQTFRGASRPVALSKATSQALLAMSEALGATPFMTLLAGFFCLLFRYTGQRDLVIGTPIAGRSRAETEKLIGLFVNTLAMRADFTADPTIGELVTQVRDAALEAYAHQDVPLEKLLDELDVPRDLSRTPLFQVVFVLQNAPAGAVDVAELSLAPVEVETKTTKFDLTLDLAETLDGFRGVLVYNADLFDATTIERMAGHFVAVLEGVVADVDRRVSAIPLLSPTERARQLTEWNDPAVVYPVSTCLHQWFEEQVERTPDRVAAIHGPHQITYGELSVRANRLAHHLRSLGVGPEVLVGLYIERSIDLVVGILGILKAGGAYVPLDPVHPPERLAFMVADAGLDVIVTEERLAGRLPETRARVLSLDGAWEAIARERATVPAVAMSVDNVAYVIYTSGSTGTPKGTPVTHRNVARLFAATDHWFEFGEQDAWSLFHSYAFDFSVWELWGALCYGGRLVVVPYSVSRSPEDFIELIARERVSVLNQTPSAFRQLVAAEGRRRLDGAMSALRYVVFGGEALDVRHLTPWVCRHGNEQPRLINMYGITETTVHVTYRPITPADIEAPRIDSPVGRPIPDLQVYLHDARGELLPTGVPGEIHVAGAGVARGYHGRPALTAERFVPSPYGDGARLYRAGDSARFLADGQLGFLGRIDQQVKIRGFRIELGEIESVLVHHPALEAAVVVAREDVPGDVRLVAYTVAKGVPPDVAALRRHLQASLPDYMVPAAFVALNALPLTPNGKLDRRALPAPEQGRVSPGRDYVAPRTLEEEALAGIWSDALHVEPVGVYDNFFEIGGDSIRSIGVVARAKQLSLIFSVQELFQHQTIDALSRLMANRAGAVSQSVSGREPFVLITAHDRARLPADAENAYPLARVQAGMLFHSQLNPETGVYNDVFSHLIRARLDVERLWTVLGAVIQRHPMLRTSFHWNEFSEPLQIVHTSAPVLLEDHDLSGLPGGEQGKAFDEWYEADKGRPFDMAQAPLLRCHVHRRGDGTWHFTLACHHAILDGWSVALLYVELFRDYLSADEHGLRPPRPSPATSYADFVALERSTLRTPQAREFWLDRLAGVEVSTLPGRRARGETADSQFHAVSVDLSAEVCAGLKQLARAIGVPLKSVLLAAHFKVQSVFAGRSDVLTGLVTNGRPEELESEQVLGVFLNSAPMRMRLDGGAWTDLVRAAFQTEREMLPFRRYPIAEIQQALGGQQLFDVLFNFTHFHVFQSLSDLGDVEILDSKSFARTNFTLVVNFAMAIDASQIELKLEYDGSELPEDLIQRMASYYVSTLSSMVSDPQARYEQHSPLSEAEREQLLVAWNDTTQPHPHDGPVQELFEAQVTRTPDAVALVTATEQLTYRALNARANRLARYLRTRGVGSEVRVGLCLRRSADLVVAVLGILKAGGTYVALDPDYPASRIAFVLEDSKAAVVLTETGLLERLPSYGGQTVCVDSEAERIAAQAETDLVSPIRSECLSHVIYTSGSTGRPKGVAIQHGSVSTLVQWSRAHYSNPDLAGVLASTSVCFDLSVWELLVPLSSGGTVVLVDHALAVPALAAAERVTLINTVPSAIDELLRQDAIPASVRTVNLAGEPLSTRLADAIYAVPTIERVCDLYGPSEDTTYSTYAQRTRGGVATIGRPIANTQAYLQGPEGHLAPIGVPGELFLGGAGLARGYLDRPDLTAERFVPDLHGAEPGRRVYRTGDRMRWLPDGTLEFLGRIDHQVKIRGFRIELGEIEAVLSRHAHIEKAIVVAREDNPGERRLVAYVVPRETSPDVAELRSHLKASLPDYMVPAVFVVMDALPLTPNGKVDRRALPVPESLVVESVYVAPRSPVEEILADLWASVLRVPQVGVRSDFFELGGHSLLATQLLSRVRTLFNVDVSLRALFEAPTVAGFAEKLEAAMRGKQELVSPPITPRSREGALPLSFAQQRLWLLDRMKPGDASYNVSAGLRLRGHLDLAAVEQAFSEIVRRQEVLRASFVDIDGIAAQVIRPASALVVPLVDVSRLDEAAREAQLLDLLRRDAAMSFDLVHGSLIRLHLLRIADDDHALLFSTHHIVCDGWSIGVIVAELSSLYVRFMGGNPSSLEELRVQYTDFAGWQREWLQGEALEAQLSFWRAQLGGNPTRLVLATDRPRPAVETVAGQTHDMVLSADLTSKLRALSRGEGATLFMTLLAAFKVQLQRYSGQDDIVVGTDMANRNRQEVEGLIGFFINLLVLRTDLGGRPSFRQLLRRVREHALEAYAHQDLPFDRLVEELQPERHLSDTPLFQVLFVLQNTPVSNLDLGGLTVQGMSLPVSTSKFDVALFVAEGDERIMLSWHFKSDLFDAATIARMANHLERLLEGIVADPDQPITRLRLIDKKKHERIRRSRAEMVALPEVGTLAADED
jgi:amino acid adenylation domain-containing protein